jgi:glutamyl-tRNA synthetase
MVISRIAPTPSGLLHRGNAYNFLLTEAIATRANGRLWLRIDDLDAPRVRPEYVNDIFETLTWLGIRWQQGPQDAGSHAANFKQAYRLERYQAVLQKLIAQGQVFACTCSRKDILARSTDGRYPGTCRFKNIPLDTPDAAWRMAIPEQTIIHFEDAFLGKVSTNLHQEVHDIVVRRRDGLSAYHITSLADDVEFDINTIVRGEDLLSSTAIQLYLSACLDLSAFEAIRFYHHPLIKDVQGEKLSKSAGSASLKYLRETGLSAAALREDFHQWLEANNVTY